MFFDRDVEHAGRGLAVEVFAVSEGLQGAGLAGKPRQHAGFDSGEVGDDEPVASLGMKAVRISCERVSGSGAWRGSKASPLPALRRVRAVARSGMWLRGKFLHLDEASSEAAGTTSSHVLDQAAHSPGWSSWTEPYTFTF